AECAEDGYLSYGDEVAAVVLAFRQEDRHESLLLVNHSGPGRAFVVEQLGGYSAGAEATRRQKVLSASKGVTVLTVSMETLTEEELEKLADRGEAIYNERLRAILEPRHNGQTVAIHLDTGDLEVGKNSPSAWKALRVRRPEGMVMTRIIGPDRHDTTLD